MRSTAAATLAFAGAALVGSGCTSVLGDVDFDKQHGATASGSGGATASSSSAGSTGGGGDASSSSASSGSSSSSSGGCSAATCAAPATCVGGACQCPSGYTDVKGDGSECQDIDECAMGTDQCGTQTVACHNTDGGYTCECDDGYAGKLCDTPVRYVDAKVPAGAKDGRSWFDAYPMIQAALDDAANTPGCEVWVKSGTYFIGAEANYLQGLRAHDGTHLYGGFLGDETDRSQADPKSNPTILDGGASPVDHDYAHHVIYMLNRTDVVIDGFTLQGGVADINGGDYASGAGLRADANGGDHGASLVLSRCEIRSNRSDDQGGGVAIISDGSPIDVTIQDCDIHDNSSSNGGGIYANKNLTLLRTNIHDNSAGSRAGGLYYSGNAGQQDKLVVDGVVLARNSSNADAGGAWLEISGPLSLTNLTVQENFAKGSGGGLFLQQVALTLSNGLLAGNIAGSSGAIQVGDGAVLTCVGCTLTGNRAVDSGADGIGFGATAPTLINSILFGNWFASSGVEATDVVTLGVQYSDVRGYVGTDPHDTKLLPVFASAPGFYDRVIATAADASHLTVKSAAHYTVGDVLEVGGDGVARTVTAVDVNAAIITIDAAFANAPGPGAPIRDWGTGGIGKIDYHLASGGGKGGADPSQGLSTGLDGAPRANPPDMGCY